LLSSLTSSISPSALQVPTGRPDNAN
jgi:hypothetical protein